MEAGTCIVREVSEEGSVSELLAVNAGDTPVLFVEGEVLRGAKQDRVLCSSVLAAGGETRIPVCCVERGRWEYAGRRFAPGSCCPPTMRLLLKQAAYPPGRSGSPLRRPCGGRSAGTIGRRRPVPSGRTCPTRWTRTVTGRKTCGIVFPGPRARRGSPSRWAARLVSVDIFDKPEILARIWGRFVDGIVFDALAAPDTRRQASGADLPVKLYRLKDAAWRKTEAPGLGETFRAEDDGMLASALCLAGVTVHLGVAFTA